MLAQREAAERQGISLRQFSGACVEARRPWTKTEDELEKTLARREERVLTKALAFTAYGTYPVVDPAEDEKTLDARVEAIVAARRAFAKAA